jgi:hypothetical protein
MASALLKYKEKKSYPAVALTEKELQKGFKEEALYVDHRYQSYPRLLVSGFLYKNLNYSEWLSYYNLRTL